MLECATVPTPKSILFEKEGERENFSTGGIKIMHFMWICQEAST